MNRTTDRDKRWYFYEGDMLYLETYGQDDKIPRKFHGPYNSKVEARSAYYDWAMQRPVKDTYEYID